MDVDNPRPLPADYDLIDFFQYLLSRRWQIATGLIAGAVLAYLLSLLIEPTYRAETVVATVSSDQSGAALAGIQTRFGGLASLAGIDLGGDDDKERALAVLRSRALSDELVTKYNLLPVLFEDFWDVEKGAWRPMAEDDVPTLADAHRLLSTRIRSIVENLETGLITISVEWTDRQQAAEWARHLVTLANDRIRQQAIDEANRSIMFLNDELARTKVTEVRESIYRLIEMQINNIMIANVREQFAFRVIDPPTVADADGYVRPKRAAMTAIGALSGALIATFFCTLALALRLRRERRGK